MARVVGGLRGQYKGLLANMFVRTWKGIPVLCLKGAGFNPRTVLQRQHRAAFKSAVNFARSVNSSALVPYVRDYVRHRSGFNWCVHVNYPLYMSGTSERYLQYCTGSLLTCQRCDILLYSFGGYARMYYVDPDTYNPPAGTWATGVLYNRITHTCLRPRAVRLVSGAQPLEFFSPLLTPLPGWYGGCWYFRKGPGGRIKAASPSASSVAVIY